MTLVDLFQESIIESSRFDAMVKARYHWLSTVRLLKMALFSLVSVTGAVFLRCSATLDCEDY